MEHNEFAALMAYVSMRFYIYYTYFLRNQTKKRLPQKPNKEKTSLETIQRENVIRNQTKKRLPQKPNKKKLPQKPNKEKTSLETKKRKKRYLPDVAATAVTVESLKTFFYKL